MSRGGVCSCAREPSSVEMANHCSGRRPSAGAETTYIEDPSSLHDTVTITPFKSPPGGQGPRIEVDCGVDVVVGEAVGGCEVGVTNGGGVLDAPGVAEINC